jgi:hypothetical protein
MSRSWYVLSNSISSTDDLCLQCRHVLNTKESWAIDDGAGFNAERFYYNIIYLFEDDDEWAQDTLDWWNEYVYPPSSSHRPYLMLRCSRVFGDNCQAGKPAPIEPQETKFQLVA